MNDFVNVTSDVIGERDAETLTTFVDLITESDDDEESVTVFEALLVKSVVLDTDADITPDAISLDGDTVSVPLVSTEHWKDSGKHMSFATPGRHWQTAALETLIVHTLSLRVSGLKQSALELHDPQGPAQSAPVGSCADCAGASTPLTLLHRW